MNRAAERKGQARVGVREGAEGPIEGEQEGKERGGCADKRAGLYKNEYDPRPPLSGRGKRRQVAFQQVSGGGVLDPGCVARFIPSTPRGTCWPRHGEREGVRVKTTHTVE